jgi:hypothetical protein
MRTRRIALAFAGLLAVGCWGEVGSIFPDAGGDTDTDTGAAPELYPGGGVGGGPLDGHLNLYLVDEATGLAVAGALVMIGDDPATALVGATAADGLVAFADPSLVGAVDVHAFAPGYVLESMLGLARASATLPLRPTGLIELPNATLAGAVSGVDELPEPSATQYRIVRVAYGETLAALFSFRGRDFAPRGVEAVTLQPDVDGVAFDLAAPPRPGALYALAGIVETYGTSAIEDDTTEWMLLGVAGGLAPSPGDTVTGLDIPLATPLTVEVEVAPVPAGLPYDGNDVFLGFDLGDRGTAWLENAGDGSVARFAAPLPAGDFADAGPLLVGVGETAAADAGPYAELPRAYTLDRGFTSWLGWDVMPWPLAAPLPPPAALAWGDGRFTCLSTAGRDLSQLVVADPALADVVWRVTVWGDLPGEIPYPQLPAEWGAPAAPEGGVAIEAFADTFAGGTSEMRFDDYSGIVTSRVLAGALVD